MKSIPFIKMHGIGNDFVVLDCLANPWPDTEAGDFGELARCVCPRAFSVGADGLLVLQPDSDCDCRMRIFNADGSEAGMCGNGIRCVARLLFERHVARQELTIRTAAGLRTVRVNADNGAFVSATVDMGAPVFEPSCVPVVSDAPLIGAPVDVGGCMYSLTAVSMGNPHGVIFVDDLASVRFEEHGPMLERHRMWPEGANIEFGCIRASADAVDVRTWERGVGETLACGTGACAVAAAAVAAGLMNYPLDIVLRGGTLHIYISADGHILMTGPAEVVFEG
ncbi:MAG: diaminopimelate epimerase, partial [Muribaculaceae bacterium]|nr:diaminopimelate epimerase [Muribaculaceae bacterium]